MQNTIIMSKHFDPSSIEIKSTLNDVFNALKEKGYNPVSQLTSYIHSGEPLYITGHNNARTKIQKIDRYDLIQYLVEQELCKED